MGRRAAGGRRPARARGADRLTGSCLCGAVRFDVDGPLREVVVCHCSLCRRAGTASGAYTEVARAALRLPTDTGLRWYRDANGRERGFCAACGATLFWALPGSADVSISAGALDEPVTLRVAAHVYVPDAAPWEHVPDDAPHHVAGSGSPLVGEPTV